MMEIEKDGLFTQDFYHQTPKSHENNNFHKTLAMSESSLGNRFFAVSPWSFVSANTYIRLLRGCVHFPSEKYLDFNIV